jgi:hypothetical protein
VWLAAVHTFLDDVPASPGPLPSGVASLGESSRARTSACK